MPRARRSIKEKSRLQLIKESTIRTYSHWQQTTERNGETNADELNDASNNAVIMSKSWKMGPL